MKETREIYALCEPDTGAVRYIGSAFDAQKRYRGHMTTRASKRIRAWVQQLKKRNTKPLLKVLEVAPTRQAQEREHHWAMHYASKGASLLNGRYRAEMRGGESIEVSVSLNRAEFFELERLIHLMDNDPDTDVRINGNLDRSEALRQAIRDALAYRTPPKQS